MQLHFQDYGRGEPLVILHGLFGSLENWQSLSRRLGEHFHVLAVDQRNHGGSPHSAKMNYRVMAEDVMRLLQRQGLGSAHVLGHSMGGKTAMQLALLHPDKVAKLVVVDIAPRSYSPRHGQIFEGLLSLNLEAFHSRQEIEEALAPAIPEVAVRRFLLKSVARSPGGGFRWKLNLQDICKNYERLSEALPDDQAFGKPTLFIRGEQSDYIREQDLMLIRRLFPRAELKTIAGASHWVHADAPEAFLEAVLEFLV